MSDEDDSLSQSPLSKNEPENEDGEIEEGSSGGGDSDSGGSGSDNRETSPPAPSGPPSEVQLTADIVEILKTADLALLTSKKVRKQLENKYKLDFSAQKASIDAILLAKIDELEQAKKKADQKEADSSGSDSDDEHIEDAGPSNGSAKRKRKRQDSDDDDEAVAKKLQQEELGSRRRAAKAPASRTPKSKAAKDKDSVDGEKPKKKNKGMYGQELILSEELAAVMGQARMARSEVVKRMWEIFKERDLKDPKNKAFIVCDDQLKAVFKCSKFKGFGMMKYLKNHMKDPRFVT